MTSSTSRATLVRTRHCAAGGACAIVLALCASACPPPDQNGDAGSTPTQRSCGNDSDCFTGESCILGLCLRRCSVDDVCDADQFCASSGFCETGCRNSSQCTDGKVCANGVCLEGGNCGTKADCPDTLVCRGGFCSEPPELCASAEDCPGEQLCNGFTQVCFDPTPATCNNAQDCMGRAGCSSDCVCVQQACVTGVACTVETEATACGVGGFCNSSNICMPLPGCTTQSQCDPYGLYCNVANRICERAYPCNDSNACAAHAPATYCNPTAHRCEVPSCINGGIVCQPPNGECNEADGRCVPPGATACSSNLNCCPEDNDHNQTCGSTKEYCDIPAGQIQGMCRAGCRTNDDCTPTQTCNSAHQCTTEQGGGQGDPCESQDQCRANYFCGPLTGLCYELCDSSEEGQTCPAACPESCGTCTVILLVPLCMSGGGFTMPDAGFSMPDGG